MVSYPPTDGSILFSHIVDFNRQHNPLLPIYKYSHDDSHKITAISHLEFAQACHRAAHAIRPSGPDPQDNHVVAIIALCDIIVYHALIIGILKAGLIPFPISPRNSPAAVVNLLRSTNCHRIVTTRFTLKPLIESIQLQLAQAESAFPLIVEEVPPLDLVFPNLGLEIPSDEFTSYPDHPVSPPLASTALYLHSSGSTGFPKPIPLTQMTLLHWATLPPVTDMITHDHPTLLGAMAVPSFHTLGIYCQMLTPLFAVRPVVVYPPTRTTEADLPVTPTPDNVLDHTRRTGCDGLIVIPTLLQIWSHSPKAIEFLRSLRIVSYSGGSPPPKLGELLEIAGVVIRPIYGGTEFGAPTHWVPKTEERMNGDWQWIRFSDNIDLEMVPQRSGVYELHVLRSETNHINVYNMPDNSGYATSDLFEKHPSKEGLWRIIGRKDDVIVHASGEKTVPAPMEDIIASHPAIQGVVMFGERQAQAGVLIELKDSARYPTSDEELQSIRNEIWPIVEEANHVAPAFSRIYKDMVMLASPEKPLPRAGKGTVMRKAALALYNSEIQSMYDVIDADIEASAVGGPEAWTANSLLAWLLAQATDLLPERAFSATDDLFAKGFDSLTATLLRHRILSALRHQEPNSTQNVDVSQTFVYENPTIEKLATSIEKLASSPPLATQARAERIESLIDYHVSQLQPLSQFPTSGASLASTVVLLTGSTGCLGSYILAGLLTEQNVARVYTFNRPGVTSIEDRQRTAFLDRGLDISLLASTKLVPLEGDLAKEYFGLEHDVYIDLQGSVSVIIHNAWRLDFNFPLAVFEPLIEGTRNLINFARTASGFLPPRFLFTSSISAVQSWHQNSPVPEDILPSSEVAVGTGYGESKYVVERVLAASGIPACSLRIGQVCGGRPGGAWAITDWVPILVKSSVTLGVLPDVQGMVSWIPMDCVGQVVLDVALSKDPIPAVINVVHPKPVSWTSIFTALQLSIYETTRGSLDIPLVPFRQWLSSLEKRAEQAKQADLRQLPAAKLMAFLSRLADVDAETKEGLESGGFPSLQIAQAMKLSPALMTLDVLEKLDVSRWVGYWANAGLFRSS